MSSCIWNLNRIFNIKLDSKRGNTRESTKWTFFLRELDILIWIILIENDKLIIIVCIHSVYSATWSWIVRLLNFYERVFILFKFILVNLVSDRLDDIKVLIFISNIDRSKLGFEYVLYIEHCWLNQICIFIWAVAKSLDILGSCLEDTQCRHNLLLTCCTLL